MKIKKNLFGIVLVLLLVTDVYGAKSFLDQNKMKYGVVLKPHLSGIDTLSFVDSTVFAPAIEFFEEFRLSSVVGLRVSLEYAYRGGQVFVDEESSIGQKMPDGLVPRLGRAKALFRTEEVQLAATPRFYLGGDEEFSIFVGPYLSRIRAAKLQLSLNNQVTDTDLLAEENGKDETISRLDYGIVMGLDYEFDSGVTLGCSYSVGLKNILPKIMSPVSAKKFSGGLILGYNFAKLFN